MELGKAGHRRQEVREEGREEKREIRGRVEIREGRREKGKLTSTKDKMRTVFHAYQLINHNL